MIAIFTDGSCSNNGNFPNKGGFGVVVVEYWDIPDNGVVVNAFQCFEDNTTNNIQELKAILYAACQYLPMYGKNSTIYSDSAYCVNSLNSWIYNWANNGWKKSNKKPVENLNLMQTFWELFTKANVKINLKKIEGHSGNKFNEIADDLATGRITVENVLRLYGDGRQQ